MLSDLKSHENCLVSGNSMTPVSVILRVAGFALSDLQRCLYLQTSCCMAVSFARWNSTHFSSIGIAWNWSILSLARPSLLMDHTAAATAIGSSSIGITMQPSFLCGNSNTLLQCHAKPRQSHCLITTQLVSGLPSMPRRAARTNCEPVWGSSPASFRRTFQ